METKNYGETDAGEGNLTPRQFRDERIRRFPERLREAMGSASVRGFARDTGLSEGVLRSYLSGSTFPTLDRLDVLAATAGVAPEWLLAGSVGDGGAAYGDEKPFDESLLRDVLHMLNLIEEDEGHPMEPGLKAELAMALYRKHKKKKGGEWTPGDTAEVIRLIRKNAG